MSHPHEIQSTTGHTHAFERAVRESTTRTDKHAHPELHTNDVQSVPTASADRCPERERRTADRELKAIDNLGVRTNTNPSSFCTHTHTHTHTTRRQVDECQ